MSLSSRQSKDVKYIAPRLRPRIHPHIHAALQNKDMLFDLVEEYGSPLNLVFPQNIHDNIAEFQSAYKKSYAGRIYFTSKPCKSLALYREASGQDIGIDVSSAGRWMPPYHVVGGRTGSAQPDRKTNLPVLGFEKTVCF